MQSPLVIFNNHFATAGKNVAESLIKPSEHPKKIMPKKNVKNKFNKLEKIAEIELTKVILKLPNKTSSDHDNISIILVKKFIYSIRLPLTVIFNKSFSIGVYPKLFKMAKILPLCKAESEYDTDNYRPISLLPVISKVLEKLMYKRMTKFVSDNNLLYVKQFGFRDKHSTQDAISTSIADILNVYTFSIHRSTVSHNLLLSKLKDMDFDDEVHDWFVSYLSNRM